MSAVEAEPTLPQSEATAEQLLNRLLELIKHSTSIADFTAATVGSALGVRLYTFAPGRAGYRARLTREWSVTITTHQKYALGPRMLLEFVRESPGRVPMTGICQVDVRKFTSELSPVGFSNTVHYGEHGWRMGNLLERDGLTVELSACSEADQPQDKFEHHCIRSVLVH